jgi:Tfp pilus assembly protein PilF
MNSHLHFKFFVIIFSLVLLNYASCGKKNDQQRALDIITARSMGLAYLEENKLPEAEAAFKQLIKLASNEPLGYANLGLVYIRMGNYEEAEKQINKALKIDEFNPEISLNLAEILILTDRTEQAVKVLEQTLLHYPDDVRTCYKLGQLYVSSPDEATRLKAEPLFQKVVEILPANIVARLQLIDFLLHQGKADLAASHLEEIKKQTPEFPPDGEEYYQRSLSLMLQSKTKEALPLFNIFHNLLKPTSLYRAGFDELKGMSGPLVGTPLLTFRQDIAIPGPPVQNVLEALKFSDATETSGLQAVNQMLPEYKTTAFTVADFDGDGHQDLYISVWNHLKKKGIRYLLYNEYGKFNDIAASAGIQHAGEDRHATFVDYNNDGYLDLYLVNHLSNVLYYHFEPKKFQNVAASAKVTGDGSGSSSCFADFDHDGDLDLYLANQGYNQFFRNNLDGTFTEESSKMGIKGDKNFSREAAFGDFDDDGDLDFFVVNEDASNILYTNLRQGQFADITSESGLENQGGSIAVSSGDYNNDGWQDLVVIATGSQPLSLYQNKGGNHFEKDHRSTEIQPLLDKINCLDVQFFDFDNDGYLDILLAGELKLPNGDGKALLLFHNDGTGMFKNMSHLLPDDIADGRQIAVADYNGDGDLDIFLSGIDGRMHLLRNDGGNANRFLIVRLVGLRTGSGKNNYFGIGAKIEVKAGDLYQSHVVTEPVSHFGLGQRSKADVVRVLWTNGIPQNLFEPGSNQALLEKQILKGSCPFLYGWNGEKYEFITDVLWRSALGMPLGIMGGETAYAFADPSQDYFKIPGELLQERGGSYSLQLTGELWETPYFDQVKLLAVDHPETTDIFVDEKFTPPPYPPFKIFTVLKKKFPEVVQDENGLDLRQKILFQDDDYISNLRLDRYQGIIHPHDLIMDLGDLKKDESIVLYLNGWVFPTDASINVALSQSSSLKAYPPFIQVKDQKGEWKTVIDNISFPMGKNKYVVVDLTGKFLSDNFRLRMRTNMQIYWDYIFFTVGEQDVDLQINPLPLRTADLHYRGFSRMYRKGGRFGPHWFDYNDVSTEPI